MEQIADQRLDLKSSFSFPKTKTKIILLHDALLSSMYWNICSFVRDICLDPHQKREKGQKQGSSKFCMLPSSSDSLCQLKTSKKKKKADKKNLGMERQAT